MTEYPVYPAWLPKLSLGERINVLRRRRGFTQADLAAAVGVSRTQIANIEAGGDPSWRTFRAIAKALSVSLDELVTGVE